MSTAIINAKHLPLCARTCSNCGIGMNEGWVWGDGDGYACSELCLFINGYNEKLLQEDYEADVIYFTTWEAV